MEETRIAPRRRILKAATIESGGGIECHVKNLSDTRAALEILSPLYVPDSFTLVVPSDQLKRRCHVVWRQARRIGIAFD